MQSVACDWANRDKVFGGRHGRAAGRAREDDRLGDFGRGQLDPQRGGRGLKRADARHHFVVDPQPIEGVHLLADRAVDARLAGVQADHVDVSLPGLSEHGDNLLQAHAGRIVPLGSRFQQAQQFGIHQRAGVDAAVGILQQPLGLDGQQIGRSRPGADKIDFHSVCSLSGCHRQLVCPCRHWLTSSQWHPTAPTK